LYFEKIGIIDNGLDGRKAYSFLGIVLSQNLKILVREEISLIQLKKTGASMLIFCCIYKQEKT
jgi:hypothetical protein